LSRPRSGSSPAPIVGTVFAGVYSNQIDEKLGQLSAAQRERGSESVAEARDVVDGAAERLQDQLIARVEDAFDLAARVGSGSAFACCLRGPRRRRWDSLPGSLAASRLPTSQFMSARAAVAEAPGRRFALGYATARSTEARATPAGPRLRVPPRGCETTGSERPCRRARSRRDPGRLPSRGRCLAPGLRSGPGRPPRRLHR
jgi:hypothetical protein